MEILVAPQSVWDTGSLRYELSSGFSFRLTHLPTPLKLLAV